jgi:hypothetical protein
MSTKLYAVVGPESGGDRPGVLVDGTTGAVIYSHISSSRSWSQQDLTRSFGRDQELARKYPEGYEVEFLESWRDAPPEVRDLNETWAAGQS